ncbi:MAG TPA: phytanoyl-CoA dioxygenase family protein [Rhizomicrobium sp.]|jgi:hypothetical protein
MKRHLLTDDEVESYRRNGYVTPKYKLPPDIHAGLKASVEALIDRNTGLRPEQLAGAHVKENKDTGVKGNADLLDFTRHTDVLDIVEQIIGPDIIMWGSQVFSKPPGDGMAIPWHQDGQYWPMRPLETVTVWVAVDPATVENGCLRVVPGTHTGGLMPHTTTNEQGLALNQGVVQGAFDEDEAVDIVLEAGQISLHHAMLVHGSNANTSPKRRCGYAIRYMPATSLFDRSLSPTRIANNQVLDYSQRPLWLLRGKDRAGNDFNAGHTD